MERFMKTIRHLWPLRKEIGKGALLVVLGLITVQEVVNSQFYRHAIETEKATGLAAVRDRRGPFGFVPSSYWSSAAHSGIFGGVPGRAPRMAAELAVANSSLPLDAEDSNRKVTRNTAFDLVVRNPRAAAEAIHQLAVKFGGYLVSSQVSGAQATSASVSIQVPAGRAEEARTEIRKLALRVESERTEAEDVTRQYVDTEARLRNLRATEQQYLQILKRAASVKDTLAVSEKLGEIRGEIEQLQAEFTTLSKRVETVTITVSLFADADVAVFGLHWRPLFRAKLALRDGVDALGDFAASMFQFVVLLPAIALWIVTIIALAAVGWKFLRWVAKNFFGWPKTPQPAA
jgi:hypothetical protein